MSDGAPVIITELALPFRVLTLAGRDRPKELLIGSEQTSVQTWYPGATKASTQVLGVTEDDIVMTGRWDNPLGAVLPQVNPFGAGVRVKTARGIQQGQNLCLMTWGTTVVKTGRLKRVETRYQKANRVPYRLVFEVDQANEPVALAPQTILSFDPTALATAGAVGSIAASALVDTVDSGDEIGGAV